MQTQTFGYQVNKSDIFEEIKKCIEPEAFYMKRLDGTTIVVTHTKDSKSNYGLNSKVIEATAEVIGAPFPKDEVPFHEGLGVYYTGYSEEEGVFMCHKGRISSIKKEQETIVFTIDGSRVSQYPGSPVFSYDKMHKILNLIGVIVPADKAVHINFFENDKNISDAGEDLDLGVDRGKKRVQVASGQFKGIEQGTGKGPRSILINGPGLEKGVNYELTFMLGGIKQNPHKDRKYNKNQNKFYEIAINAFAEFHNQHQTIPDFFTFDFFKEEYTATKE